MYKCIHCKKYSKDQYRCEITGTIRNEPCEQYQHWYWHDWFKTTDCKYFKLNLFAQLVKWFNDRFKRR